MSVPPGGDWKDSFEPKTNPTTFNFEADDTYGRGQTIYLVEDGIDDQHPVCTRDDFLLFFLTLFQCLFCSSGSCPDIPNALVPFLGLLSCTIFSRAAF